MTEPENDFSIQTKALLDQYGTNLLNLAALSIRHGLTHHAVLSVSTDDCPEALLEQGACFVTLKKGDQLRGCIGSPEARRPLIEDVTHNAFSAAFRDPRFKKLEEDELEDLNLSISVLSPQSPMNFIDEADFLSQLRPGIDGLVIEDNGGRALFLPSVWQQLSQPKVFLGHLKAKAGLGADHWSGNFKAWRFIACEAKADSSIWHQP